MEYRTTTGAWLEVNDALDGKKIKFVNECVQAPSDKYKNDDGEPKITNLVKVEVEGLEGTFNMRPNWTSIGAMKEAFGTDSMVWIGKPVTARVKDATTGQSCYLLPAGFELYRNEEKRWAIRKIADAPTSHDAADMINAPSEEGGPTF